MSFFRNALAHIRRHALIYDVVFALLLSFFVCLIFSEATSPLYPFNNIDHASIDSNVFMYEAHLLLEGRTPYIDFYDHKGMLHIYIDAFGLLLGGRYGVFALEVLVGGLSLFLSFRIVELLFGPSLTKRGIVGFLYLILISFMFGGNQEGTWVLPATMASLFFLVKAMKEQKTKHLILAGGFAGLEAGMALSIRPSDALWGFALAVSILVFSLRKKRGFALLYAAITAISAFFFVNLVMVLAAFAGGFLNEEIAALLQNLSYLGSAHDTASMRLANQIGLVILVGLGFLLFFFNRKKAPNFEIHLSFFLILCITSGIYFLIARYLIYYWSGLLFYCVYAVYALSLISKPRASMVAAKAILGGTAGLSLLFSLLLPICFYAGSYFDSSYAITIACAEDIRTIPEEDRAKGNVYGIDTCPALYFGHKINPSSAEPDIDVKNRYYGYQSWWAVDNPKIGEEVTEYLSSSERPKFVLLGMNPTFGVTLPSIKEAVLTHYELYNGVSTYSHNKHFDIYVTR